jgi:hypothetical protein
VIRRRASFVSALLALELGRPAIASADVPADAPRVLLVRPSASARAVSTALVHVEGELVADGFDVVSVEAAPGTSSEAAMQQAQAQATSTTVGLFLSADGTNAELWVVDKLTNKTVVRHVATPDASTALLPDVLAVRAVELLRASLLELVVEQAAAARPARSAQSAANRAGEWAARPLRTRSSVAGIEMGAGVIWSPGQVEPAFESVVRGRLALSRTFQLRLAFVGLGTRPQVSGREGTALITQWGGLGEILFVPFRRLPVSPIFSVGAGTFHSSVTGQAGWPYEGLHDARWAFAADAGVGLSIHLDSRLELTGEADVLWTEPEPIVQFASDDIAHLGQPGVLGTVALLGWL